MRFFAALIILIIFVGCSSASLDKNSEARIQAGQAEQDKNGISRTTLQGALLRFDGSFGEELRNAFRDIENSSAPEIRYQALKNRLAYISSSMDIALGTVPEANLLDMVALVELSRDVLKNYWIPNVYGAAGTPVLEAFDRGQKEIWRIASLVLTPQQIPQLRTIIENWRAQHPHQITVEAVRLTNFAAEAGAQNKEIQEQVGGLLANVKQATLSADQAILLGERALYYAQRAPFLLRMQGRLAVSELIASASEAIPELSGLQGLIGDGTLAMHEGRQLIELIEKDPTLKLPDLLNRSLSNLASALREYNHTLSSPIHAQSMAQLQGLSERIEATSRHLIIFVLTAAMIFVAFFGVVVVLTRRLSRT